MCKLNMQEFPAAASAANLQKSFLYFLVEVESQKTLVTKNFMLPVIRDTGIKSIASLPKLKLIEANKVFPLVRQKKDLLTQWKKVWMDR